MRVLVMGLGRFGRTMVPLLRDAGHEVVTWSRGQSVPSADLTWITVSDTSVKSVASLVPSGSIVLHASARLEHEVLRPHSPAGSLHPLMSFPGPELVVPRLAGVPAAVAGDPEAVSIAGSLARSLGMEPVPVPGDRRLYHAACVMAGNLSVALLADAAGLLECIGVQSDDAVRLLYPLVSGALVNVAESGPVNALTGPYARADADAVQDHRFAISHARPELLAMYEQLAHRALELARKRGVPARELRLMKEALNEPLEE